MADKTKGHTANLQFAKLQRAEDGKKAMSEYETAAAATRAKTERLRALRMARDAEENTRVGAASIVKTSSAKTKAVKKKKAPSSTLSAWLDDQKKDGLKS